VVLDTIVSLFRFLIIAATVVKIVHNYKKLIANHLFTMYFIILLLGGFISLSAQIYLAINYSNPDFNVVDSVSNAIEVFGVIFLDIFFGLIPNLFYSIYKTKLTEAGGKFSPRYFYINGIMITCMFVILLIAALTANEDASVIITDSILTAITIYSFCFYLVVIHVLQNLEERVRKIIRRYFAYYCIYAVAILFRNAFLIGAALTQDNPALMEISFANFPVDTICAGVTLVVVTLFLKDIKLPADPSQLSSKDEVITTEE